ncbi:MAG TPA: hypothetical protein VFQ67_11905 [Allosphingosinicella sp.]|jgi:cellobiose-specific phosphotransferase system component IIA|nr:hypothetical protein [Allosphingosinicella sp.]
MVRKVELNPSRADRRRNQDDLSSPRDIPDSLRTDIEGALLAGESAEQDLQTAEAVMRGIADAAAQAQEALYDALRAAEKAEEAAGWVLDDARRMLNGARARAERVRALLRTEETIASDLDGGARAIGQAQQGEFRAIESSIQAVNQAMRAASEAQRRIDLGQADSDRC